MRNLIQNLLKRNAHHNRSKDRECPLLVSGIPPPSHEGGYKLYKNLFFFVGVPLIGLALANVLLRKKMEDEDECGRRPPFVKYEYLRVRSKRFPWGDGNKSFFHNPKVNALPDGYEDDE